MQSDVWLLEGTPQLLHSLVLASPAGAENVRAVTEAYILPTGAEGEILHLSCVSPLRQKDSGPTPELHYAKGVLTLEEELLKISFGPSPISQAEYYDKLLGLAPHLVENKLSTRFTRRGRRYTFIYHQDRNLAVLELRKGQPPTLEELAFDFPEVATFEPSLIPSGDIFFRRYFPELFAASTVADIAGKHGESQTSSPSTNG